MLCSLKIVWNKIVWNVLNKRVELNTNCVCFLCKVGSNNFPLELLYSKK